MKKIITYIAIVLLSINLNAQTNLLLNGTFEATSPWLNWSSVNANGNLYGGSGGYCSSHGGLKYIWLGDNTGQNGVNNATEDFYQTVTIPSNTTNCILGFYASINTSETGASPYDFLNLKLRATDGTLLTSLGNINNTHGTLGIPGCQTWAYYYVTIPAAYYGSTVRVSFEFSTDGSSSTIFRLDDITLNAVLGNPCTYSLSQSNYTCLNATANSYNNISTVNTQNGCAWNASVTSGASWLSTSSSGTGNGNISINVLQNTTSTSRNGIVNVNGQTITIIQPAGCTYSLSQNNYTCPNTSSNTYSNILLVNTQAGCNWNATVTSGNSWLASSSTGSGSGAITITVLENTTTSTRIGTIDVNGQTLTINQPGISCTYNLAQTNYTCANASANIYNNIVLLNTQTGCTWTATVSSGGSWLASSSSGTNSGFISITVLQNTTSSLRTGTIQINNQTLTIIQPAPNTSIHNIDKPQISIYPNPSNDIITVEASNTKLLGSELLILNTIGQKLYSSKIIDKTFSIDLSNILASGLYIIQINDENENLIYSNKILLNK